MDAKEIRDRIERIGDDEKPEKPRFSVSYMDLSMNPRVDFYRFCNGEWINSHPIPEDKIRWSAFMELFERNRYILGKILEECAFRDHSEDRVWEQVGSFYP